MITINLLPLRQKQRYKMELNRRLVVFYSIGILLILAVFIALLLSINLFISIQNDSLEQQIAVLENSPRNREIKNLELTMRDFLTLSRKTNAVKNTLVAFNSFFPDLERVMPEGVNLNSFSLNRQSSQASLSGFALTRTEVINFKENLESLSWIKEVDSPLSNLIKEKDINFNFNLKLSL